MNCVATSKNRNSLSKPFSLLNFSSTVSFSAAGKIKKKTENQIEYTQSFANKKCESESARRE